MTRSPSVTVVDGCRAVVSRAHLLTTDPDTPPRQIRYDVIAGPEVGRLSVRGGGGDTVTSFTQADVDDGLVEFVHELGGGPTSFVFQVVRHTALTSGQSILTKRRAR